MNREEFTRNLCQRVRDNVVEYLYQDVVFTVEDESLLFQPHAKSFQNRQSTSEEDNLPNIHCSSWSLLHDILIGTYPLLEAFQSKDIYTNGYLPQLFVLMLVFQPESADRIPE